MIARRSARSVSRHALTWLDAASELHTVHATDKVFNLLTDQSRLVSIVGSPIGDGPHNLVLSIESLYPVPPIGERAFFDGEVLGVDGFAVDISRAALWDADQDWTRIRSRKGAIADRISEVSSALESEAPDEGIPAMLSGQGIDEGGMDAHFANALIRPAAKVVSGLNIGDKALALEGASELAGLGSGLTPAGDDYLTGAMLACWAGFAADKAVGWLAELAEHAAARTSQLSAAYLHSAGEGLFGQIWHSLIRGLTAPGDGKWRPAVSAIARIGHNSGAYTLAGFISAVMAVDKDDRLPVSSPR